MKRATEPEVLYDGRDYKVHRDINGNLWRYDKTTGGLAKDMKGEWEPVDTAILDDLKEALEDEFVSPLI